MGTRLVPDMSQLCNKMAENDFICMTDLNISMHVGTNLSTWT